MWISFPQHYYLPVPFRIIFMRKPRTMKSYKCSLGIFPFVCLVAWALIAFLILMSGFSFNAFVLGAIVGLSYANVPGTVKVDDDAIKISRLLSRTIPFSSVTSITPVVTMQSDFYGPWDKGVFISFSYTGVNLAKGLGSANFYCTQLKNFVVIATADENIVISPDDPDAFIADIRTRHPHLTIKHPL